MTTKTKIKLAFACYLAAILIFIPTLAFAHEGDTIRFGSFLAGLFHPVLGLDHFLAMVSVGIISSQIGGRAIWTIPATFVGVMAVGWGLGVAGISLSYIELGIALSVVVLGIAIALNRSFAMGITVIAVGLFAIFHGYAHGVEMPSIANPTRYALGFLTGTAIIHLIGVLVGDIPTRYEQRKTIFSVLGSGIAVFGVLFVVGIL
ncbi:MAG: HupE/UreJ family protein [Chloroflexota bacterium]